MWLVDPRFNFMGPARYVTAATLLLAALAAGVVFAKGFNYSIDFTGGTAYTLRAEPNVEVETLRRFLEEKGFPGKEAVITQVQAPTAAYREFLVKLPPLSDERRLELERLFASELKATVLASETVGPAIGEELRRNAVMAVLVGLGLILLYVAFRFDWTFGVASILAVAHDVAIVAGMYSLLGLEFSIPTIAALLTIVGYSINDSIVVSDRIRENQKLLRHLPYAELVNRSINQTLSRTVMTSLTTLLPILALLFLGGSVLQGLRPGHLRGHLRGNLQLHLRGERLGGGLEKPQEGPRGQQGLVPFQLRLRHKAEAEPFFVERRPPEAAQSRLVQGVQPQGQKPVLGARALQEAPPPLLQVGPGGLVQDGVVQPPVGERGGRAGSRRSR